MNFLEEEKRRMKIRRHRVFNAKNTTETKNYVNMLISRILISIIVFFGLVIISNTSLKGEEFVKNKILTDNISFSKIGAVYNKYFGNIIPFEDIIKDDATVFNEKLEYEEIKNYKDGYELKVKNNYLVPIINSGIVVFVGEKEELGNTVIIQGTDEVDYWYSNVENITPKLYDFVEKGSYLGTTNEDKLYLTFKKDGNYLEYNEVLE